MSTFHERKAARVEYFNRFVKGWKLRPCTACNGSGYYDHSGSPDCAACNGTGKERYKPEPKAKSFALAGVLMHDGLELEEDLDTANIDWIHDQDMESR
jgi:hypothetical protein